MDAIDRRHIARLREISQRLTEVQYMIADLHTEEARCDECIDAAWRSVVSARDALDDAEDQIEWWRE